MHEAEAAHHLQHPVVVPVRLLVQLAGMEPAAAARPRRLRLPFVVAADTNKKSKENRQLVVVPSDRELRTGSLGEFGACD
jgi:hypothetical protein